MTQGTLYGALEDADRIAALPRMAGGSDQAEGAEGAPGAAEGTEGAAATPDALERLASSFETFQNDVTNRFETITSRLPEQQAEEEVEDDDLAGYEFEFGEEDYDDDGALTPEASMRAMQDMMRQVAAEQMRPHLEAQAQERRIAEADALEERYSKLQDETFQTEMIDETIRFCQEIGRPELAREPRMLEIVYLAHEAQQHAENEVPAGSEREVVLSRSGAAGAGQGEDQGDDGDRIVKLATQGKFRLNR
jgi:hypothetical protein